MFSTILKSMALTSLALVMATPAAAQVRADIGPLHIRIANNAPPRARYEVQPARPGRDSVWIRGYWDRRDDRWDWVTGRWEQPRDGRSRWVVARYSREGCPWYNRQNCAWRYEPAHWSHERLVEGDDYRAWKTDRSNRNNRNRR